jgi:hypothetical protein
MYAEIMRNNGRVQYGIIPRTPSNSLIKVSTVFPIVSDYVWLRPYEPEQLTQQEIKDTLKWLDEVRLNPEVREARSEDDRLEFVELVKSSLQ